MGTRAVVGIKNADGKCTAISVNYDGYLEYMGNLLLNHYKDIEKVRQMLELGAASSLGENLEDKSTFYVRDRGEKYWNNRPITSTSMDKVKSDWPYDYNFYILDEADMEWYYSSENKDYQKLSFLMEKFNILKKYED